MNASATQALKVLLIDDDEDDFVLVKDFLGEASLHLHSYSLDWCPDYSKAESHVISGGHDAYLIDYRLGAHTGIELIEKIRAQTLVRAMIVLTGQGDDSVDKDAERAGAADYLVKSEINAALLDRSIRYAVASSRNEARIQLQAQLLQNVHDAVFLMKPDGTVITWNRGATRVYGFGELEMVGHNVKIIFPPGEKDRFLARVYPTVSNEGACEFIAKSIRKDGAAIYVAVRASVYGDSADNGQSVLICANDITPQKLLEQRMLEISEREQRRIGQDIHDDLCQQLAGIGCLAKVLEQQFGDLYANASDSIAQLGRMVTDANVRAREIARGLAPSVIENLGLRGALEELAAQSRVVYQIDCRLEFEGDEDDADDLHQAASVQLFRIAQEAVRNAVKHGKATSVSFELRVTGGELELQIRDNGKGMPCGVKDLKETRGLGLLSMRHRAEVLDGELGIESDTPSGVIIKIVVPRIPKNEDNG